MNSLYVSIIFLGTMLIIVSLFWILYDWKKSGDYSNQLEKKKQELVGIIGDAEQMVEEMNRFSDYIVNQMDFKNEELCLSLKKIDEKIKHINLTVNEKETAVIQPMEKVVNGNAVDICIKPIEPPTGQSSDLIIENMELESMDIVYLNNRGSKAKDKVIPLNSKYKEVIQLAGRGFSNTEIARRLNMGKGEVQLILDMNK